MLRRMDHPARETATEQLRTFVRAKGYVSGDRLPPERELTEILGLGRAPLRRALEHLEREGLIWRHVGKGTFVGRAGDAEPLPDPFGDVAKRTTPMGMIRARLCVEPAIAREAALNASQEATARIAAALARCRAAASWPEYERQDDAFHRAVAEATDNPLLLALFDGLNRARREVALGAVARSTARPSPTHESFVQHEAIAAAIEARDREAAHGAMRAHLHSVAQRLFGEA